MCRRRSETTKRQKLNERYAFVAVLTILAYCKINNLRGINAGLENKSTLRNDDSRSIIPSLPATIRIDIVGVHAIGSSYAAGSPMRPAAATRASYFPDHNLSKKCAGLLRSLCPECRAYQWGNERNECQESCQSISRVMPAISACVFFLYKIPLSVFDLEHRSILFGLVCGCLSTVENEQPFRLQGQPLPQPEQSGAANTR